MGEPRLIKGRVDVLADFCISSLVIICFVKSFSTYYELSVRFLAISSC